MRKTNKLMMAAVLAVVLPTGAMAAEVDLQAKIDKLSQQMEDLKGQVERIEDKSLGKWLKIGGSYQFRIDSLHGETAAYTSALGTMNNLVNGMVNGAIVVNGNPLSTAVAGTTAGGAYTLPGGFVNNRIYNPNAGAFIFQGKAGTLFTQNQFGTIMNSYMPSAMYNMFFGTQPSWATNSNPQAGYVQSPMAMDFSTALTLQGSGMGVADSIKYESLAGKFAALSALQMGQIQSDAQAQQMFGKTMSQIMADGAAIQAATAAMTPQQYKILDTLKAKVMPAMMKMMTPNQQAMMNSMMANPAMSSMAFSTLMQGFLGAGSGNLVQYAGYKPKNETLYTNKFSLDLHVKATQNVTATVKLGMYKAFGNQDNTATANGYFADRVGVFDGVLGHVPSSSYLNVDRAYVDWKNIMDQPIWFSVGRRPATDGSPTNLKADTERPGVGGTPALLVNYAFDGMTLGFAPDFDMLPGFYTKVCYGRGFESGYRATPTNSLKDTDMLGVAVIPIDTDPLRVWMQWNRGFDIFDFPTMQNTIFGNTGPSQSLGSIDWFGLGAMSTLKKVGPGNLNFFLDGGVSVTHPSNAVSENAGFQGLLSGQFFAQDTNPKSQTGYAVFAGLRYDLPSRTKIGFEYNYGSKYWITFAPAADDMWTSKLGTRGSVFEPYVIQELNLKPISSYFSKAFFKVGYQYYDFQYTGSNNWVGEPVKISEIKPTDMMLMAPVKSAHDIYGTFEVHF